VSIGQPFPISSFDIPHRNWINIFKRDHLSSHQQAAAMQNPPAIKDDIASTKIVQVWIVIRKTICYFFFLAFALRWTL
jgi:hypothetical protein